MTVTKHGSAGNLVWLRRKAEEDQGINMGTQGFEDGFADEYGDWGWMEAAELDD